MRPNASLFLSLIGLLILPPYSRAQSTAPTAAEANPQRYLTIAVPTLKTAPKIDGTVDAAEWKDAGMAPRLVVIDDDHLTDLEARYYYGITDDALYVAFQIQRPEGSAEPRAAIVDRDRSMWRNDDAVELWLSCLPTNKPIKQRSREFYFMWNARGTQFDRMDVPTPNAKWNPDWQCVSRTVPGYGWEGEVRIPLKQMPGVVAPQAGDEWLASFMDNQSTPFPRVAISAWSAGWTQITDYPHLRFTGADAPFVRVLDSGLMRAGDAHGGAIFEAVNPGTGPQKINAKLKLYRKKSDSKTPLTFLRSFEQSRDTTGSSDQGKVLLFVADDKLIASILSDGYDLVTEKSEEIALGAGERKTIDFAAAKQVGDYVLFYEFRGADGKLIAASPLQFVVPAPMDVKFANYFLTSGSTTATIDLTHIPGWKGDGTIDASVTPAGKEAEVKSKQSWPGKEAGRKVEYKIEVKGWPVGDYALHLSAKDPSGKALATREIPLHVPETPKWFTDRAGFTPAVPEPWTPIVVSGEAQKLSFLMGDYDLSANSPLPAQINVRAVRDETRVPILRAPIAIKGKADGNDIAWSDSKIAVKEKKDDAITISGEAKSGAITLSSDVRFEYDGMEKLVLTLTPAANQKVELNELYLEVPLKKEFSALYLRGQTIATVKDFFSAGKIPDAGLKHPFVTSIWLGNEERGFRWFSENMRGWRVGKKYAEETIEVLNSAEGATLKLNFVKDDKPLVLDKPRQITLAWMFTPPKTIREDVVKLATTLAKEPEGKIGHVREMEVWYFKNQGWPEIYSDKEREEKLQTAKDAHAAGMLVTPYSGWFIPRASDVYGKFGGEMVVEPLIDGGVNTDVCCWNTPVQDAWVGLMSDRIKDIDNDGFRLDAGFSVDNCSSLVHHGYGSECGWIDDYGNVQPSKHLFAARQTAQRAYRLFHGGAKEHGVCIQHVHGGNRYDPILANMDAVLSVEGIEMTMRSMAELPLDFYRANVMGDQHGYQVVYLPKSKEMGYDSFHGLALLHDFIPRGGYPTATDEVSYSRAAASPRAVWAALDWIAPFSKGDEFWGYWKNSQFLQTSSARLIGSFHVHRGEKLLLGVMNLDRAPVTGKITLDLKSLGFGEKVYAYDPILREPLALEGGNTLTLDFTPEGYRAVQIASAPFDHFVAERIGDNLIPEASPARWPAGTAPAGWTPSKYVEDKTPLPLSAGDVVIQDNTIVLTGDGKSVTRFIKSFGEKGKSYMLEMEATIICDDHQFLGKIPRDSNFYVSFGELYTGQKRTMTGEPVAGHTQTFRLYETGPGIIDIQLRRAAGNAIIKKIEMYEIKVMPKPD